MELVCDDRERKICSLAKDKYDNVYIEHLTIGDFLIGYKLDGKLIPLVIVERKTWADLAASFKDGRIHNIEKLRSYREATRAKIAYLLEGPAPKNPAVALVEGIPYKNLRAHLDHLIFKDDVIELHSLNTSDTLRRLLEFTENLSKFQSQEVSVDGVGEAKIKIKLSREQIADKIWSSFEGISLISARPLRGIRISSLYKGEVKEDELAEICIGARKLGPKRAQHIFASLSKEQTLEKILCAVPGISTKKTRLILDCLSENLTPIPLADLFINWPKYKVILEKKIGPKSVLNMEEYLQLT